jgi:tetratricopeptide (TPR) repeat protein
MKNYTAALEYYGKLLDRVAASAEDLKLIGKTYQEMKNDTLAIRHLERSLEADSTQTDIYTDLGASYMRLRNWERASEMYAKRIEVDPNYATAYVNYALSNMAMQKWVAARTALKAVLELQPSYLQGHLYLARCLAQMDSLQQSRKEYEKVIEIAGPSSANYKSELGESHKMVSLAYLVEKNYPKALDALTSAVVYKPQDVEVHLWRAQTLHALDRREEATNEYNVVLKLDPDNPDAKRGLEILALYN